MLSVLLFKYHEYGGNYIYHLINTKKFCVRPILAIRCLVWFSQKKIQLYYPLKY
jgi:hypothetical protein